MTKIYSKQKLKKKPSKEVVNFILSYSKSLKIVRIGKLTFEQISN